MSDGRNHRKKTDHGPRVGYLLRMYPRFTQTFIVNEILELERQGLDVSIVSLRKPNEGIFHQSIAHVKARAHYIPETRHGQLRRILGLHWPIMRRSPRLYARDGLRRRTVLAPARGSRPLSSSRVAVLGCGVSGRWHVQYARRAGAHVAVLVDRNE